MLLQISFQTLEPWHEISNNVVCVSSKASDQSVHTRSLIRAFVSRLNIIWMLSTDRTSFGISKLKRRLQRLIWVYTCQNPTLLEITCQGSFKLESINIWTIYGWLPLDIWMHVQSGDRGQNLVFYEKSKSIGHWGVYVPLRALFLVWIITIFSIENWGSIWLQSNLSWKIAASLRHIQLSSVSLCKYLSWKQKKPFCTRLAQLSDRQIVDQMMKKLVWKN